MGVSSVYQQPSSRVSILPALSSPGSMDAQFLMHDPYEWAPVGLILSVPWKEGRRAGRRTGDTGQIGEKEETKLFWGIAATLGRREQPLLSTVHGSTVISKVEQKPSQNNALQSKIKEGHLFQASQSSHVSEDATQTLSPLLPSLGSRAAASAAQQLRRCEMLTRQLPAPFASARLVS